MDARPVALPTLSAMQVAGSSGCCLNCIRQEQSSALACFSPTQNCSPWCGGDTKYFRNCTTFLLPTVTQTDTTNINELFTLSSNHPNAALTFFWSFRQPVPAGCFYRLPHLLQSLSSVISCQVTFKSLKICVMH